MFKFAWSVNSANKWRDKFWNLKFFKIKCDLNINESDLVNDQNLCDR